jgi:hypothetical protein
VTAEERPLLHEIQKLLSTPLEQVIVEGFEASQVRARWEQPRENRGKNRRRESIPGGQPRYFGRKAAAGFKRTTAEQLYGKAGSGAGTPGASGVRAVLSNIATIV